MLPSEVPEDGQIAEAIAAEADWMQEILARLVEKPTVLGNEEPGQAVMREAIREIGLEPVDVPMDAATLRAHPLGSPFDWDVEGKANVVARWATGGREGGSSLILNGHIDVVSPEPLSQWHRDPFVAHVEEDWLSGRGAADMKCGLAAILGAVKGLRRAGLHPHAPVTLESVVEEECTGNGTLQTLLAGYAADAAVITEPYGSSITTSQVGVLWFQVKIEGIAGHAAGGHGVNAIEESLRIIDALRALEVELNAEPPAPYDAYAHPIGLNVGTIAGGDWPSTVPGECITGYRIALYPGMEVRELQARIEAVVAATAADDPAAFPLPPEVRYVGFGCEGYAIEPDHALVRTLSGAHARIAGSPPAEIATTSTTDARVFGQAAGIPAVCFGPYAEGAHGSGERVYLPSVVQTAQVLGLLIRDWCGLS